MIKKGSKVVLKKPLKVLEVIKSYNIETVLVSITYTDIYSNSRKERILLPRKLVKEYKEEPR